MKKILFTAGLMLLTTQVVVSQADSTNSNTELDSAQIKQLEEWAAKYHSSQTIAVSAETTPVAIIKVLAEMGKRVQMEEAYAEEHTETEADNAAAAFTSASEMLQNQSYGNITVTNLEKEFIEEFSDQDSGHLERKTISKSYQIQLNNEEGDLLVKYFSEQIGADEVSQISIAGNGLTFSDLIEEMQRIGIEIEHQAIATESFVKAIVPGDLLAPGK